MGKSRRTGDEAGEILDASIIALADLRRFSATAMPASARSLRYSFFSNTFRLQSALRGSKPQVEVASARRNYRTMLLLALRRLVPITRRRSSGIS
jgi:hypothetical protein